MNTVIHTSSSPPFSASDLVVGSTGTVAPHTPHKTPEKVLLGADDECSFNPLDHGSLNSLRMRIAPLLGSIPLAAAEGVPASMRVAGVISRKTRSGRVKVTSKLERIKVESPSGIMVDAKTFEERFPAQFARLLAEIRRRALVALSPAKLGTPTITFLRSQSTSRARDKLLIDFSGQHAGADCFDQLWVGANFEPGPTGIYDRSKRRCTNDLHPEPGLIGAVADDFPWGHGPFHLVATLDRALKASWLHALDKATNEVVDAFLRGSGLTGLTYPNLVTNTRSQRDIRLDLLNWIQMSASMVALGKVWRAAFNVEKIGQEVRRCIQSFEGAHLRELSSAFGQVSLTSLDVALESSQDLVLMKEQHGGLMPALMSPAVVAANAMSDLTAFVTDEGGSTALFKRIQDGLLSTLSPAACELIKAQSPRMLGTLMSRAAEHLVKVDDGTDPDGAAVNGQYGFTLGVKWAQMLNLCATSESGPFLPSTSLLKMTAFSALVAGRFTAEHDGKARESTPEDAYSLALAHRLLGTSMRPMKAPDAKPGSKGGNSLSELALALLRHARACIGQHPTGFARYMREQINKERLEASGQERAHVPQSVLDEVASLLPSLETETCSMRLVGIKSKGMGTSWSGTMTFEVVANRGKSGDPVRALTRNGEKLLLSYRVDKRWFAETDHWDACESVPNQHMNARQAGDLFPKMVKVDASGRHNGDAPDLIADAVFGSPSQQEIDSAAFGARIVRHCGALAQALQRAAACSPFLLSSAFDIPAGDAQALDRAIESSKARSLGSLGKHLRASLKSSSAAGVYAVFRAIAKGRDDGAGEEGSQAQVWSKALEMVAMDGTGEQMAAAGRALGSRVPASCLDRAMDAAIARSNANVLSALLDLGGTIDSERMAAVGTWHDSFKDEKLMAHVSSAYMRHAATQARKAASRAAPVPDQSPARANRRRTPCL